MRDPDDSLGRAQRKYDDEEPDIDGYDDDLDGDYVHDYDDQGEDE